MGMEKTQLHTDRSLNLDLDIVNKQHEFSNSKYASQSFVVPHKLIE